MDRYHSIAHFADFQVRSSLNRSQKDHRSKFDFVSSLVALRSFSY